MNNILRTIFLLILTDSVYADAFYVGGTQLDVPSPQGFLRVTEQMDAVYRLSLQMADPMNDQLAYYISESDIPAAMAGELPALERYFILKVNKKLKGLVVGSKEFEELKSITKRQNAENFESIESKIPGLMEETSKGISEEFDINFALQLTQMVPLDPHYETDNALAFSMYINYGAAAEGEQEAVIVAATATFVNVAGKILLLYCYGPQNELEWTRNVSKAWAGAILASNSQPPPHSPGSREMNWNAVFGEGIAGAIAGGLFALLLGVFSRFKRKSSSRSTRT